MKCYFHLYQSQGCGISKTWLKILPGICWKSDENDTKGAACLLPKYSLRKYDDEGLCPGIYRIWDAWHICRFTGWSGVLWGCVSEFWGLRHSARGWFTISKDLMGWFGGKRQMWMRWHWWIGIYHFLDKHWSLYPVSWMKCSLMGEWNTAGCGWFSILCGKCARLINLYLDGSSVTVLLATDGMMITHQQWSHGLVHNQIDHLLRNLDHLKVEQRFSMWSWSQVHINWLIVYTFPGRKPVISKPLALTRAILLLAHSSASVPYGANYESLLLNRESSFGFAG